MNRWLFGVALAVVAAGGAADGSGRVVSWVVVDEQRITINVPIDVVGGDPETFARWERGIDLAWNAGNDGRAFRACGREVRFVPHFRSHSTLPADSSRGHLVFVEQVRPGERYVSRVWHALGTSPSYSPRTGYWASTMDARTAAHEFGHLLGLLDEYVENDLNRNGLREPGERPVADTTRFADAHLSVMASDHGSVLQRHVREVLRVHGVGDLGGCLK